jgi:hydroxymethylbilane synthase
VIRIVTRNSKLALWQAKHVSRVLKNAGLENELIPISTKGDKILDVTLHKIGSKGVFTEELESMLAAGEADIAVHSAKDLQSTLPDGFEIIAFSKRENPVDVLVSDDDIDMSDDLVIGTSSTRRVAYLKHYYPHFEIVDMRGNLQTRIDKMRSGSCDALLLAYAGVNRMGYDDMIKHQFDPSTFVPAVGQGSLAVECHQSLDTSVKNKIRQLINDTPTENCLLAERSYLATMNGGCSIPVFGLATVKAEKIHLKAGIISLNGQKKITENAEGHDPVQVGRKLAEKVLSLGGDKVLEEIKSKLNQS